MCAITFVVGTTSVVAAEHAATAQSDWRPRSQQLNNTYASPEFQGTDLSPDNVSCRDESAKQLVTPTLSAAYLRESQVEIGRPHVVVGYYNLSKGLLAGYQSNAGKRIVLRARWLSNGAVSPEVIHLNPASGKIEVLMGRSKQLDAETGARAKVYEVVGVDFQSFLADGVLRRKGPSNERDEVRQFMDGNAGEAFSEAIPALYAALESLEDDPKLAKLQSPLGAILTVLQLSTGVQRGFAFADAVLGSAHASALRENCSDRQCQYQGSHFTVRDTGLFDAMSKSKAVTAKKSLQCAIKSARRSAIQTIIDTRKNGDGNCTDPGGCFGGCGPDCFTPGDIYTPQCLGHDTCVCKYGYTACVFDTNYPNCDDCDTLVNAIWSYLTEIFRRLFECDDPEPDPEYEIWW